MITERTRIIPRFVVSISRCCAFSLLTLGFSLLTAESSVAEVFKYVDSAGVTHYTTRSDVAGAEAAELPQINRGEIKLMKERLLSCDTHGGVDCPAGPDADGSVICGDGFTDASPVYRFSCSTPRLKVAELLDEKEDGTVSVLIRNSKSVAAADPQVLLRKGNGEEIVFSGPPEIAPYGAGEFVLSSEKVEELGDLLTLARIRVSCTNCSG